VDKFQSIQLFTRVAALGSFSAAAREVGLTQSAVSKAIASLEDGLGTRLLNRNTRRQSLTEAGERYLAHCAPMLDGLQQAEEALHSSATSLHGRLRVTAPVPFGARFVAPALAVLQQHHPGLRVHVDLTDEQLPIASMAYDLAIRLGEAGSETTVVSTLGQSEFRLVASPQYLAQNAQADDVTSLDQHRLLGFSRERTSHQSVWHVETGEHRSIKVGRFSCNSLAGLHAAVLAHQGIAVLPLWLIQDDVGQGRLSILLQAWRPRAYPILAVYPSTRQIPLKVRRVVGYLRDHLRQHEHLLVQRA